MSKQLAAHTARTYVADFWDNYMEKWIAGEIVHNNDLYRWQASYEGKGAGEVNLKHYPDPFVGDIRGIKSEPRIVILGLNPGIGYNELQARNGIWAQRIAKNGYSYSLDRSPAQDPLSWKALHRGRSSMFWQRMITFAQRWLQDDKVTIFDLLGMELYPWHSKSVTAEMAPPADIIDKYIWAPIHEIDVNQVFAFGKPWFSVCEELGLEVITLLGSENEPIPGVIDDKSHWRLGLYKLPSKQLLVVSSQTGSNFPPGSNRVELMRRVVNDKLVQLGLN